MFLKKKGLDILTKQFFLGTRIFSCGKKKNILLQEKNCLVTKSRKKFLASEIMSVGDQCLVRHVKSDQGLLQGSGTAFTDF